MDYFYRTLNAQNHWLHELAKSELYLNPESLSVENFNPQQLVEEDTICFLNALREHFTEFSKVFNTHSEQNTKFQEVKVYTLGQSAADFMLYRNQMKLIFSNMSHGVIQASFSQHFRGNLNINGQEPIQKTLSGQLPLATTDFLAQMGPFRDVYWTFQGERIDPSQIAKFYFIEFIKSTRNPVSSENQVLLKQIKAFLQEKGLDL